MTKQEIIELLQDQVQHNRIEKEEFYAKCEEYGLDWCDDVLAPIGYNVCDRCGDYGDSELDFFWIDGFDWDENNPEDKAILRGLQLENKDYCAICGYCIKELKKKGMK